MFLFVKVIPENHLQLEVVFCFVFVLMWKSQTFQYIYWKFHISRKFSDKLTFPDFSPSVESQIQTVGKRDPFQS